MPWYAWLILLVALGSIVGGLMMLRDTAKKPVLMRASGLRTLSPAAQTIYRLNACATDLFALAMPQKQPCGMEQTKNVVRLSSTG